MRVSEIWFLSPPTGRYGPVKAFLSIILRGEIGGIHIHDIKIIDAGGRVFIQFPSRKRRVECSNCSCRVEFDAQYCSECGAVLPTPATVIGKSGREVTHNDYVCPIDSETRQAIMKAIMPVYEEWKKTHAAAGNGHIYEV